MNLRDHVEVAVQVSRLVLPVAASRPSTAAFDAPRFWGHVHYLEHLWSKDQDRTATRSGKMDRGLLTEELLTSHLLIRCVAAATHAQDHWQKHLGKVDLLLAAELQGDSPSPRTTRLGRMWKRLSHWGDFLVSRHPRGALYSDDPQRCEEFQASYRLHDQAVWSLLSRGICQAVPDRMLTDLSRSAVHRTLQEQACCLIQASDFLRDGRLKPIWMRRIECSYQTGEAC